MITCYPPHRLHGQWVDGEAHVLGDDHHLATPQYLSVMGAPTAFNPGEGAESAQGSSLAAPFDDDDESEWEHEYDEVGTEDFYFTLDLTSNDPKAALKADFPRADKDDHLHIRSRTAGQLQVLDLHGSNPVVKFDDTLYSCAWSTDLGTQVHVASSGVAKQTLRPGHVVDVVSTSRARLVGTPATLKPRHDRPMAETVELEPTASNAVDMETTSEQTTEKPSAERQIARFAAARQKATDPALKSRASFLERFSKIKQSRGETDLVPFYGVKKYHGPKNKDEIRAQALTAISASTQGRTPTTRRDKGKKSKKRAGKQRGLPSMSTPVHAEPNDAVAIGEPNMENPPASGGDAT
jgi:hypothetical protein